MLFYAPLFYVFPSTSVIVVAVTPPRTPTDEILKANPQSPLDLDPDVIMTGTASFKALPEKDVPVLEAQPAPDVPMFLSRSDTDMSDADTMSDARML